MHLENSISGSYSVVNVPLYAACKGNFCIPERTPRYPSVFHKFGWFHSHPDLCLWKSDKGTPCVCYGFGHKPPLQGVEEIFLFLRKKTAIRLHF